MGTAPFNFPPDSTLNIGQLLTGSKLNLTATLATTTFFTAQDTGLYLVSASVHIVTTNAAGTLVATLVTPHAGSISVALPHILSQDPDLTVPSDGFFMGTPVWMAAGDVLRLGVVAAGLTGTTYNCFVTAQRLF